jgi:UDP-glucose 6-dehydrogenase
MKNVAKLSIALGLVFTLSGCFGSNVKEIQVSSKPLEKSQLTLPAVDELNLRRINWIVINESNLEQKVEELKSTGQPFALFALTGEGYENLGLNFSDIRAMVQQQQAIIVAYENYYQAAEAAMENATVQE